MIAAGKQLAQHVTSTKQQRRTLRSAEEALEEITECPPSPIAPTAPNHSSNRPKTSSPRRSLCRVRLWEAIRDRSRIGAGRPSAATGVAFSPDAKHIVSTDHRVLRLWEVATGREIARFDGDFPFETFALAPNGKWVTAGDARGRVHVLDVIIAQADKTAWHEGGTAETSPPPRSAASRHPTVLRRLLASLTRNPG
jgi:WD40 repeat protein